MSEGLEQALSRALRSVFAFTEAGGHYFSSIAYEDWSDNGLLPSWFRQLIASAKEVFCVAFGPGDAAVVTYLDKATGTVKLETRNLDHMPKLVAYLNVDTNPFRAFLCRFRDLRKLRVTFGDSEGSFFATDGHSAEWDKVPDQMQQQLRMLGSPGRWTDKPRVVALGTGGDYMMVTESNTLFGQLLKRHPFSVVKIDAAAIHDIYLFPFSPSYIIQELDGSISSNVPKEFGETLGTMSVNTGVCIALILSKAQERTREYQEQEELALVQALGQRQQFQMMSGIMDRQEQMFAHMHMRNMQNQQNAFETSMIAGGAKWVQNRDQRWDLRW